MGLIKCYDPAGNELMKEPVDARECFEHCGFTMEPPEVKAKTDEEMKDPKPKGKRG